MMHSREEAHELALTSARERVKAKRPRKPMQVALEDQIRSALLEAIGDASGIDAAMLFAGIVTQGAYDAAKMNPKECPGMLLVRSMSLASAVIADLILAKDNER